MPMVPMYDSVATYQDDPYLVTVCPARFGQPTRLVAAAGLTGVSGGELLGRPRGPAGRDLVGLTFDDGYADFLDHALPHPPGTATPRTVFVLPGSVETTTGTPRAPANR